MRGWSVTGTKRAGLSLSCSCHSPGDGDPTVFFTGGTRDFRCDGAIQQDPICGVLADIFHHAFAVAWSCWLIAIALQAQWNWRVASVTLLGDLGGLAPAAVLQRRSKSSAAGLLDAQCHRVLGASRIAVQPQLGQYRSCVGTAHDGECLVVVSHDVVPCKAQARSGKDGVQLPSVGA